MRIPYNAEVTSVAFIGAAVAGVADSNGRDNSHVWLTEMLCGVSCPLLEEAAKGYYNFILRLIGRVYRPTITEFDEIGRLASLLVRQLGQQRGQG